MKIIVRYGQLFGTLSLLSCFQKHLIDITSFRLLKLLYSHLFCSNILIILELLFQIEIVQFVRQNSRHT
jgi:hypothetical protein